MGVIESVNVGTPREVAWRGQAVWTAIWKDPVAGRVTVRGTSVEGDQQGNPETHGGVDKALYAYAAEDYEWWEAQLGRELGPGTFGENLTVRGVDVSGALVGERWRAGVVELEVSGPRTPCYKLGYRMGDQGFVRRFAAAGRPGAYLRILAEGELGAGDPIDVHDRPDHGITVELVSRALLLDESLLGHASSAPALPAELARWMRERAD